MLGRDNATTVESSMRMKRPAQAPVRVHHSRLIAVRLRGVAADPVDATRRAARDPAAPEADELHTADVCRNLADTGDVGSPRRGCAGSGRVGIWFFSHLGGW